MGMVLLSAAFIEIARPRPKPSAEATLSLTNLRRDVCINFHHSGFFRHSSFDLDRAIETRSNHYFRRPSVSLTFSKLGSSFGEGVCSLYWITPFLSITKAARAAVS